MKMSRMARFALLLLAAPLALHASGGCVNSPENPTVLLGLMGIAGAGVSYLRRRRQ